MDGIEPHWNKIRTVVLDSADQFKPVPPLEFDLTEGSAFQKQLMEVYNKGNGKEDEQKEMGLSDGLIRFSIGLDADIERTYQVMRNCMEELNILKA